MKTSYLCFAMWVWTGFIALELESFAGYLCFAVSTFSWLRILRTYVDDNGAR